MHINTIDVLKSAVRADANAVALLLSHVVNKTWLFHPMALLAARHVVRQAHWTDIEMSPTPVAM